MRDVSSETPDVTTKCTCYDLANLLVLLISLALLIDLRREVQHLAQVVDASSLAVLLVLLLLLLLLVLLITIITNLIVLLLMLLLSCYYYCYCYYYY